MKQKFPILITHQGVNAKIYRASQIQNSKTYPGFVVVYMEKGIRQRIRRSTLDEAEIAAKNACHKISHGNHLIVELTESSKLMYLRAIEPLKPIGVSLEVATTEYASAITRLPSGATLSDAVDFFCRRNAGSHEKRTVRQVADEMFSVKQAAKLSDSHLKDLKYRLDGIAKAFQMNIGDVTGVFIQVWIDNMAVSGRTKQNYLRVTAALWRFAISRKCLPKEAIEEIEGVQLPKEEAVEVEIYTPAEMLEILTFARLEMIPWLAIAAFAGLRSAEIYRLDWSEINLAERIIEIKASKAKTGVRRLVPITDNLAQWLTPYAKESGPVVCFESWWNQIPKIADAVNTQRKQLGLPENFQWRHNALRHSFCSYRLAVTKHIGQVAEEAGNSPQMIKRHYLKASTEKMGLAWFDILPPVQAVTLKLAA